MLQVQKDIHKLREARRSWCRAKRGLGTSLIYLGHLYVTMGEAILAATHQGESSSTVWKKLFTRSNTTSKAIVYSSTEDGNLVLNYIALYFNVKISNHIPNGIVCVTCSYSEGPGVLNAGWGPCEFYTPLLTRHLQSNSSASSGDISTFIPKYYIGGINGYFTFTLSSDYVRVQTKGTISDEYVASTSIGNISVTCYGLAIA